MYMFNYPVAQSGQWITPVRKGFKAMCCGCGLIHKINFKTVKGVIKMQVFRDDRATASARRKKK